ncbi:MAG: hypothetical protein GX557_10380 [Chloroflexi bacterium]|nr:hypothetical protein [Chloroflexota bacterium]
MLGQLTRPDVWRALLVGLGFSALYALGGLALRLAQRWLAARTSPAAVRMQRWPGWAWLAPLLAAAAALAWGSGWAFGGVLAGADLGLLLPERALCRWALGISGGAAVWLALLWRRALGVAPGAPRSTTRWWNWPLTALADEGLTAIWRAALAPLAGDYWSIWLAPLCAQGTRATLPTVRRRLADSTERPAVLLAWALDWVGSALFLYTRSAWTSILGRALCGTLVWLVCARRRRSADDQR